jgi:iron complex transport system ATP-binding protein
VLTTTKLEAATPEPSAELDVRISSLALGGRIVLRDLSLSCSPGSHTAILGPNGAGKTSLLRAVAGLIPYEGHTRLGNDDLGRVSGPDRARRIAYVPQRSLLDSALPVEAVVMQGRYAHQSGFGRASQRDQNAVTHALGVTDTEALRHRSYIELSGGEQRRVLLARALATEAPVVLLDEPTASLDIAHALEFFAQLSALANAGRIVLTILHDLRDAERFCDRALVLHQGSVRHLGTARLPATVVGEVYGVRVRESAARDFELEAPK